MGERGPPKQPAAVHQQNGTYRADRHGSPNLPVQIPLMPEDMEPTAQACWKVITNHLQRAGLVAEIDGLALRGLCEFYAAYVEAIDHVREHGLVITNQNKNGTTTVVNPAYRVRSDAWKHITTMLRQFGMTPSARTGINFSDAADGTGEEDRVKGILGICG